MKRFTDKPELNIKVYSMEETLFLGPAFSLLAESENSSFAVLPEHANLLSVLKDYTVHIDSPAGQKDFYIGSGMLKVSSNQIVLFVSSLVT